MTVLTSTQTSFGQYRLLKRIAQGGMAEIFRALALGSHGLTKLVAIKRMLPQYSSDPRFVEMFINEANLNAKLNHVSIVQIYDFGIIDGTLYLCMEYVQGATLTRIMRTLRKKKHAAPISQICKIFADVLYGLDLAHRQCGPQQERLHIVHRDISPSNLLVSYSGQVKTLDFGIAKAVCSNNHTAEGNVRGKLSYMSPEQAAGKKLDHRTDIYSLGVCFYEMLALSEMYPDCSTKRIVQNIQKGLFEPLAKRNANVPRRLAKIVHKALAKNPSRRYSSAAKMRDDLEKFLFDSGMQQSRSRLSRFMEEHFSKTIVDEQQQIAAEYKLVRKSMQLESLTKKADPSGQIEQPQFMEDSQEFSPSDSQVLPPYPSLMEEDHITTDVEGHYEFDCQVTTERLPSLHLKNKR